MDNHVEIQWLEERSCWIVAMTPALSEHLSAKELGIDEITFSLADGEEKDEAKERALTWITQNGFIEYIP